MGSTTGDSEHGLRNVGGVINRLAGVLGWHLAGAGRQELGRVGSVSYVTPSSSVGRQAWYQAGRVDIGAPSPRPLW